MLSNTEILKVIKESFATYLNVGTSRSTAKLKKLHGSIAKDLQEQLGDDYSVKSQGIQDDKEGTIEGRYYSKNVDILIKYKNKDVAGYAIKFVMRNYSQNSNNYFECMLGETANIRANSIPYFQIFIIFDKVPYYLKGGTFKNYDTITEHHIKKYLKLSKDNPDVFFHTPNKTLIILLTLKEEKGIFFKTEKDYATYYSSIINEPTLLKYSTKIHDKFDASVILNNYEDFIERTIHIIKGHQKK
jgi:hypothetical protein